MTNRLSKKDWLRHGFSVLKTEGHVGLKADRLVKGLRVSRGSFYWHFENIQQFHQQLLEAWRERLTKETIAELEGLPDGQLQLTELIWRVISNSQELEAAIRAWAQVEPKASLVVAEVDDIRIDYVARTLVAAGINPDIAKGRATLLAWAYVGNAMMPGDAKDLSKSFAMDVGRLLMSKEGVFSAP